MLTDGRYDAYIRQVQVPIEGGTSRIVVDLVQVFHDQAAIADGKPRSEAQYLYVWIRNQNPGCGPYRWPATCGSTCSAAATVVPGRTSSTTWAC